MHPTDLLRSSVVNWFKKFLHFVRKTSTRSTNVKRVDKELTCGRQARMELC